MPRSGGMGFLFPCGLPRKGGLRYAGGMDASTGPGGAERSRRAIKRLAHLEDDWSNVACCSAMRPRPTPRPGPVAREPDVAWPAPTETPPLEHVA